MSDFSISIQNKNGISISIDENDLKLLTQHKQGHWCFKLSNDGSVVIKGTGRLVKLHRLIMGLPAGNVGHINRNKLDNRKENLRTRLEYSYNKKVIGFGLSRFRGVSKNGKNWKAVINYKLVAVRLGNYDTELEAALAYDAKAKQLGCAVRFLNFPDGVSNVSTSVSIAEKHSAKHLESNHLNPNWRNQMPLTIEQHLNELHHDPIKDEYMGLINNHYFELSHGGSEWQCKTTGLFNRATPARFCTYGPSPIKALSKAMQLIADEVPSA